MPVVPTDVSLLARLNALRPTTVSLTSSSKLQSSERADPEISQQQQDLSARFAKLSSGRQLTSEAAAAASEDVELEQYIARQGRGGAVDVGNTTVRNEEDDRSLEELLRELDLSNEDREFLKAEQQHARNLAIEAEEALRASKQSQESDSDLPALEKGDHGQDGHKEEEDKDEDELQLTEEQEADEYISRVLAEASFEEQDQDAEDTGDESADRTEFRHAPALSLPADEEDTAPDDEDGGDEAQLVPLPSAPTSLPATPAKEKNNEERTFLPSTPSSVPSSKPSSASQKSNLRSYTDEEIDTWCIICCANAEIRCLGCDGDLYCHGCWDEGHRGESAGYEERRHRAVAFVKGGGVDKKKVAKRKVTA